MVSSMENIFNVQEAHIFVFNTWATFNRMQRFGNTVCITNMPLRQLEQGIMPALFITFISETFRRRKPTECGHGFLMNLAAVALYLKMGKSQ